MSTASKRSTGCWRTGRFRASCRWRRVRHRADRLPPRRARRRPARRVGRSRSALDPLVSQPPLGPALDRRPEDRARRGRERLAARSNRQNRQSLFAHGGARWWLRVASASCSRRVHAATPARIVSTSPSITETLFALGLGDRVVGVSTYCRYPEVVKTLPKVGTFLRPDAEVIARLRPDLVIVHAGPARRRPPARQRWAFDR